MIVFSWVGLFLGGCGSGFSSKSEINRPPVAKSLRVTIEQNNKKIIEKLNDKKEKMSIEDLLQSAIIKSNVSTKITLEGSDAEDQNLTFIIVSKPLHGYLQGEAPNLTYTSDKDFFGQDVFSYKVSDGEKESEVATVDIDVRLYKLLSQKNIDGEDDLIYDVNYTYYDNALMRSDRYTEFLYDERGDLSTKLISFGGKVVYTYDTHHKIVSSRRYDKNALLINGGINNYDSNNSYDSHGNVVRIEKRFLGQSTMFRLLNYTYDADNRVMTYTKRAFDIAENETDRQEVVYDSHGNTLEYKGFYANVMNYRQTKSFNPSGYLTLELIAMGDQGYDYRHVYEDLDGYGNPKTVNYTKISDHVYQDTPLSADNNQTSHYRYSYDKEGNMLRKEYLEDNGSILSWYEYSYDTHSNILAEKQFRQGKLQIQYEYTWREFQ